MEAIYVVQEEQKYGVADGSEFGQEGSDVLLGTLALQMDDKHVVLFLETP